MQVEVNATRLWFDVDGPALVADGPRMRERPTVVLVHGGPGTYDHSYFKPDFGRLAQYAQVVYLDLRGHGRSEWGDAAEWSYEVCADDLRAFCDAIGISRPIVYGHSMGSFIVMLYAARHPRHAGGIVLQSAMARFDVARLVDGFRRFGGDEVAELARRDYTGDAVTSAESERILAVFGPHVPSHEQLARTLKNADVPRRGAELFLTFDVVEQLARIERPTLVCVGELDPMTPVEAAQEIVEALPAGIARLEVLSGAGHFSWLDIPDRYWPLLTAFITEVQEA